MAAGKNVINLAQLAAEAVAEKLGTDIVAIDMTEQMVLSEVFLICTGSNEIQVDAIADGVLRSWPKLARSQFAVKAKANGFCSTTPT